jgi:hypothetical protein
MNKMSFLLLCVVFLFNSASLLLYLQVDNIVHIDLYDYGLQFSLNWGFAYWNQLRMFRIFMVMSIALLLSTIITLYAYGKFGNAFSRRLCILLPLVAANLIAISTVTVLNIDRIVNNMLYQYGLQLNGAWLFNYWTVTRVPLILMALSACLYFLISTLNWMNTRSTH